jgi:hypothetical protein
VARQLPVIVRVDHALVEQIARLTAERDQARAECAALIDVVAAARQMRDAVEKVAPEELADAYTDLDGALYGLDQTVGYA